MNGVSVPHIVDVWRDAGSREYASVLAELSEALAESGPGVGIPGLRTVSEKGSPQGAGNCYLCSRYVFSSRQTSQESAIKRNLPNFREAYEDRVPAGVIVADAESQEFAAPQAV